MKNILLLMFCAFVAACTHPKELTCPANDSAGEVYSEGLPYEIEVIPHPLCELKVGMSKADVIAKCGQPKRIEISGLSEGSDGQIHELWLYIIATRDKQGKLISPQGLAVDLVFDKSGKLTARLSAQIDWEKFK